MTLELLLALVAAVVGVAVAAYFLGLQQGTRYWHDSPATSKRVQPLPPVEPLPLTTITVEQVVAVDTAIEVSRELVPELERQTRLTKRYRREKNTAQRALKEMQ